MEIRTVHLMNGRPSKPGRPFNFGGADTRRVKRFSAAPTPPCMFLRMFPAHPLRVTLVIDIKVP